MELYIHVPFCVRKCAYCDFLSAPADADKQEAYVTLLLTELEARAGICAEEEISSVFIGGGTPSVLSSDQISRILQTVYANYRMANDAEISIETNPGTVSREKLQAFWDNGINRLSIGLQSAESSLLHTLGRIHSYEDFLEEYTAARQVGFQNINVDLMGALPGQSMAVYEQTLQQILNLDPSPEHISVYSLIVEEGTPFYQQWEAGTLTLPDEETERAMYWRAQEMLQAAGYHRYEISNFSRAGRECVHNLGYWTGVPYLGFGLGAASDFQDVRWSNPREHETYERYVQALSAQSPVQTFYSEYCPMTKKDRMEEFMFLGLRLMKGVGADDFENRFHQSIWDVYGDVLRRNEKDGLLQIEEQKRIFLTARGLDLANYVYAQFLQ